MAKQTTIRSFIFVLMIALVITACAPQMTPSPIPAAVSPDAPLETAVVIPPPTPSPQPRSVYLIAPVDMDQGTLRNYQEFLSQRAALGGFLFERLESFPPDGDHLAPKIAVFLDPPEDIRNLADSLPETQFVVLTDQEINPTANLSVIIQSPAQQAFLAGFIAILVAQDYRAGGLFADNTPLLDQIQDGYLNGARYLCGRCTPVYGPIVAFPQVAIVPGNSPPDIWQTAFDQLDLTRIHTLFIPSQAAEPQFLNYLSTQNVALLGTQTPPEGFADNWIATVQVDTISALDQLWPDLINGNGGQTIFAGLVLSEVNENLLTPGKMIMVEQVKDDLQAGWISPHTVREE